MLSRTHPDFPAVPDIFVAYTHDALPGGTAPHWASPTPTTTCARLLRVRPPTAAW